MGPVEIAIDRIATPAAASHRKREGQSVVKRATSGEAMGLIYDHPAGGDLAAQFQRAGIEG